MHQYTHITFSQLSKSFRKRPILRDTQLSLESGECILLTGRNGTGKTTLMRILAGLEKPDQCRIQVSGKAYTWRQYRHQLQHSIMYLHQQPYMFSGSVRKNLDFALPRSLNKAERHTRIQEIVAWAGLGAIMNADAKSLSGGECQRVAIARARLRNPQALLLDEPAASMDWQGRDTLLKLVEQLKREQIALLLTSHDPDLFSGVASRFLHLEQQQITTHAIDSPAAERLNTTAKEFVNA